MAGINTVIYTFYLIGNIPAGVKRSLQCPNNLPHIMFTIQITLMNNNYNLLEFTFVKEKKKVKNNGRIGKLDGPGRRC
jgi:hypothetical protein